MVTVQGFTEPPVLLAHTARLLRDKQAVRIVCYGDSISEVKQGWSGGASATDKNWGQQLALLLRQAYPGSEITVLPFGIGGQNAYEGLGRLETLRALHPDLVLLEFGTNDCCYHYLQPEETRLALSTLAQWTRERFGAEVMIVGTGGDNPLASTFRHVTETVQATRQAAEDAGVPFIDMRAAILKCTDNGKRWAEFHLAANNCHPNDHGHRVWAETVWQAIQQAVAAPH